MKKAKRKQWTIEEKRKLVAETNKRPVPVVAAEAGVNPTTMYGWRKRYGKSSNSAARIPAVGLSNGNTGDDGLRAQVAELRDKNDKLVQTLKIWIG
jgi:transposase-like protein